MAVPDTLQSRQIPASAAWLGGTGVIPFLIAAAGALVAADGVLRGLALQAFVAYSAVILSFLGGVRWGAALSDAGWKPLALSVAPSLIAFGALLLDPVRAILPLTLVYAVIGASDALRRASPQWPAWFATLRARLSGAVVAIHLALLAGLWWLD